MSEAHRGPMGTVYRDLGGFSDWVALARRIHPFTPLASPGPETQRRVREVLGFSFEGEAPADVRLERSWEADGLLGAEVSWWVGYGPRTHAWVLKPADASGPLPGVVALHDHGGFKWSGKEKIADGPEPPEPFIVSFRDGGYGGRAYANALAKEGYVVLVPDAFCWGSRRFPFETMPQWIRNIGEHAVSWWTRHEGSPDEVVRYNAAAAEHESEIEKYSQLLGTTFAGVVSYEDRVAANYLASRPDVASGGLGCVGLSGGGSRAALLQATSEHMAASVIVGMMSTYQGLLDHNVTSHTWMLFPSGWAQYGDWPDLAACRAPSPLLVQFDLDDGLFTVAGMRAAHERMAGHYQQVGHPESYVGQFYPGPHKFDLPMQEAAFAWLGRHLKGR